MNGVAHRVAASGPNGITVTTEPTMWRESVDYRTPAPRQGERWVLTRRWVRRGTWLTVIFAGFWNIAAVVGTLTMAGERGLLSVFPIPALHLIMGAGLAYYVAAEAINTTTITIEERELTVGHGPVWWPGQGTIAIDDITGAAAQSTIRVNNRMRYKVAIFAYLPKGGLRVRGLLGREEAEFIAKALTERLSLGA